MRCLLDDLGAFGINADQRTTVAEDEEERFMVNWIAAEKARGGLQHAVVYAQRKKKISTKKACSCWLARES